MQNVGFIPDAQRHHRKVLTQSKKLSHNQYDTIAILTGLTRRRVRKKARILKDPAFEQMI